MDKGKSNISAEKYVDVVEISDNYSFHFFNAGIMHKGKIYTYKVESDCDEVTTLSEIMEKDKVDERFFIKGEKLDKFKYYKGSKKFERKKPNGETYMYSEGAIAFPDKLDAPARTMLTSESTVSRTSHIIVDNISGEYRILTPLEAERIQMFPDNWTNIDSKSMTERRRYFLMGNALVVGIVSKLGKYLESIVDNEN